MNYAETIARLETFPRLNKGDRLSLLNGLLHELGDPQKKLRFVHITGTNGKGSSSAMTEAVLRGSGYRTGLFTSPHLHAYPERIRVDFQPISEVDFARHATRIFELLDLHPEIQLLSFEFFVLLALLVFEEKKVDLVVWEVGIGGGLDSTNVVNAEVAAITNVGLEHRNLLGHSLEAITLQKLGILKEGATLVTSERDPKLLLLMENFAQTKQAVFRKTDRPFEGPVGLLGNFQKWNAALLMLIVEALREKGWIIPDGAIQKGLQEVYWPLRMEQLSSAPRIFIDIAHNLEGVQALMDTWESLDFLGRRMLLTKVSHQENWKEMLKLLVKGMDAVFLVPSKDRAVETEEALMFLKEKKIPVEFFFSLDLACKELQNNLRKEDTVLVTGSIQLAAHAARVLSRLF